LVGETEDAEPNAAVGMIEVEALGCAGAPVVAYGDDASLVRKAFGVKDLSERVGLLLVIVAIRVGRFGAPTEAEQVGDN